MIVGAATNERSTDAWSAANFLSVLGFHWAPVIPRPVEPLGFNVAIRRKLLGHDRLQLGQYEMQLVPRAMEAVEADASFPVDHVQYRRFPQVLYYHWCNGRVTGSFMRKYDPAGFRKAWDHAANTCLGRQRRQRRLRAVLRAHPLRHTLVRGTFLRLQLLAITHSLGSLWGGIFEEGRAPWELE
jgi:hypothetical protein